MPRTLDHSFQPYRGSGLGLRLRLTREAVEVRRFGIVVRRVPLSEIVDVSVPPDTTSRRNLRIRVREGADIEGHVEAVSLWKFALRDRLGIELLESAAARDSGAAKRRAA